METRTHLQAGVPSARGGRDFGSLVRFHCLFFCQANSFSGGGGRSKIHFSLEGDGGSKIHFSVVQSRLYEQNSNRVPDVLGPRFAKRTHERAIQGKLREGMPIAPPEQPLPRGGRSRIFSNARERRIHEILRMSPSAIFF